MRFFPLLSFLPLQKESLSPSLLRSPVPVTVLPQSDRYKLSPLHATPSFSLSAEAHLFLFLSCFSFPLFCPMLLPLSLLNTQWQQERVHLVLLAICTRIKRYFRVASFAIGTIRIVMMQPFELAFLMHSQQKQDRTIPFF